MTSEPTIYQVLAERAPAWTPEERQLLERRREALLFELAALNRALGLPTETRKERRAAARERLRPVVD